MAKHKKEGEKGYTLRDYVIYFVIAFIMIMLTASFVIENIYNQSDNVSVTPDGTKAIYETCIGQSVLGSNGTITHNN